MSKDLFSRYIWLVDTIKRYGHITREELNVRWKKSPFSNGEPLPRRTFYNYRVAIEELFKINIECNPSTFEYYIEEGDTHNESVTNWLLNTTAMNNVLSESRDVSNRIFIEDVPSAREFLASVIDALKEFRQIKFTYQPYTRSNATPDIVVHPYFLKIFRQRWYITGLNVKEEKIKTYALDRMRDMVVLQEGFEMPADFDAESYTKYSFGIVFSQGEIKNVSIKASSRQAKYLRALPLHSSQQEMIHDDYSIFTYRLRITPDFVQELLSHGPNITVIDPPELKAMIITSLEDSLANYKK
ncbi:MAG: WYL domain-containing protein [Muribaculaceae bacterium]|nr:WYL domain-containing protein [Muribaculaceae bacterium]MBR5551149.1 WYL domain-containing protein [Muribaculaceae bacterium]